MMRPDQATVGTRVRTTRFWSGVPKRTEGVIDAVHPGGLIVVAWDLPWRPLPTGYREYDGQPAWSSKILRDGFSRTELHWLEVVGE